MNARRAAMVKRVFDATGGDWNKYNAAAHPEVSTGAKSPEQVDSENQKCIALMAAGPTMTWEQFSEFYSTKRCSILPSLAREKKQPTHVYSFFWMILFVYVLFLTAVLPILTMTTASLPLCLALGVSPKTVPETQSHPNSCGKYSACSGRRCDTKHTKNTKHIKHTKTHMRTHRATQNNTLCFPPGPTEDRMR